MTIKGIIIRVKKGYTGQIRGDDGLEYRFNRKSIVGGDIKMVKRGRRVEFEPDGEYASKVRLLEEIAEVKQVSKKPEETQSSPQQPNSTSSGKYRFLNPYNFVRYLDQPRPQDHVLGDCEPPPHDRYVGLTGRIKCRLIAQSPIFVSDSHDIREEPLENRKRHPHYRFFRTPDGDIAIPASTLRGSIRNIFEIATNSCFAQFSSDKHLSDHLPPKEALKLIPARVEKRQGKYLLHLLPGTTSVMIGSPPAGPQYAAWVYFYTPLRKSKTTLQRPRAPYSVRQRLQREGWTHKDKAWALIELVEHPLRHFRFWNVVQLAKGRKDLPKPKQGQRVVEGYLCINHQNIENKHDERFFFRTPENASLAEPIELPDKVIERYKELITDYQERHADEIQRRRQGGIPLDKPIRNKEKKPALSRHIIEKKARNIEDGDLVYAMLKQGRSGPEVAFLVPVSVPRILNERALGELLPTHLHACTEYSHLCPACRVFGWVHPEAGRESTDKKTAYAGRVRFTHAIKIENTTNSSEKEPFDATLSILSTPKPTTFRFYLRPQHGKPQNGKPDAEINYDAPNQVIRGRKIYRRHRLPLDPNEYQSPGGYKSDQNRTVHEIQPPGTIFEFMVEFENLAPAELGALLWALEMEGWHHRIGYAKPLGFGEASIEIVDIQIVDMARRYQSLARNEGWVDALDKKERWVQLFKSEMARLYRVPAFEKLPNIRDLEALLGRAPNLPVHYPRSTKDPQPEGRNYEWFLGNKRSGRNAGPRLVLPLAEDDTKGLPLIDRQGNIVEDD